MLTKRGSYSRSKGKRYERKVRTWLNKHMSFSGQIWMRTAASGALDLVGDICLKIEDKYYSLIECKSNLDPWSSNFVKYRDKCIEQNIPFLIFNFRRKDYIAAKKFKKFSNKSIYVQGWEIISMEEQGKCFLLSHPRLRRLLRISGKI